MATPCRRVYIGAAQWSPKAKIRSFADSTVEAAVQHARRGPLGLNATPSSGVISVFDVKPDAKTKTVKSIGAQPRSSDGPDLVFDEDGECLVLRPSTLKYVGFNLVGPSDAKVVGRQAITACLRKVTARILDKMPAGSTAWDVNNGLCEDWAQEALIALGGDPIRGGGGNVYWFDQFRNEMLRAEGLPEVDEDGMSPISHAVLSYAGRWYDAQHPGGVDTLSALAITQGIDRQQWLVSNRRLPPYSVCPRR